MTLPQVKSSASAAEKAAADKKQMVFVVTHLPKNVYSNLKSMYSPNKIGEKKFEENCSLLEKFYGVRRNPTAAAYHFKN